MKNYIGFYIILLLLCIALIISAVQFDNAVEKLLSKAYAMKDSTGDVYESYIEFINEYKRMENILMMLVNHTQYKEISRCILRLEHNIYFADDRNTAIDIDELIFLLEEMIDGEKCTLKNIF